MSTRIEQAKKLLQEINHVSIATVNPDGSPHGSPVFMAFDDQLNAYWASSADAQHSRNILRNASVFLTVFDSRQGSLGMYVAAVAEPLDDEPEVMKGLELLRQLKARHGGVMGQIKDYTDGSSQRVYRAVPIRCWVNQLERDSDGIVVKDSKIEVSAKELSGEV